MSDFKKSTLGWAASLTSRKKLVNERILCSYIPAKKRKDFLREILAIKERALGVGALGGLLERGYWLDEIICSTRSVITFTLEREACFNVIKKYSIRLIEAERKGAAGLVQQGELVRVCYVEKESREVAAQDILRTVG